MRLIRPILTAFLLLFPVISWAQPTLESRLIYLDGKTVQFGNWVAGCDNLGQCTAIGVAIEHPLIGYNAKPYMNMISRFTLPDNMRSPVMFEFWPREDGKHAQRKERYQGPYVFRNLPPDQGKSFTFSNERTTAPPEAAFAIINMMQKRRPIRGVEADTGVYKVRFPEAGFAELWPYMQKAQERAITIQEFSARTLKDHEFVRLKTLAPAGSYNDFFESKLCDGQINPVAVNRYRLSFETDLFELKCPESGAKRMSHFFYEDKKTKARTKVSFPLGDNVMRDATAEGLDNVFFDERTLLFESTEYDNEADDCGVRWRWANSKDGWVLLERSSMNVCWGIKPADWITTYRLPFRRIP